LPERSQWRAGTPILFALAVLRSVPQASSQFRDLATVIHEISELAQQLLFRREEHCLGIVLAKSV
jgi:hypothetical protein